MSNNPNILTIIYKPEIKMNTIISFFDKNPVFTQEEFNQFLSSRGNTVGRKESLIYHLRKGYAKRIRRGFFVSIPAPFRDKIEELELNPYLVAGRVVPNTIIAYHSAFDFHGVSPSPYHQYLFLSEQSMRSFKFNGDKFTALPFSRTLSRQNQKDFGVIETEIQGLTIKITGLERTIVDVLHRPIHGGGWKEIWETAAQISTLDLDQVIEYVKLLNNATTVSKLGFFLEQFKDHFNVDESYLNILEALKPCGTHYLERNKRESGTLLKRWNLMVPLHVLEQQS